jgi:FHS family L-fucose permease-like MFS transporter
MLTKIKAGKLLTIFGVVAAALVLVSILSTGTVAIWALIIAGFFNSIMFPNIFALGIAGLGPMTSKGSGLIMTAVWGGALIPVFIGWISDHSTYALSLLVPVVCYLYIAFYGFAGHKPTRTATT